MRITHKTSGSIVALGVVMAVTACGGASGTTDKVNDTLKIGVPVIPTTLDPGKGVFRSEVAILQLASGMLTTIDEDGKGVGMGLAQSVTAGPDRFVVTLKPKLKFSDGSPITATDVVASFEHYLADKTSGVAYTFAPIRKVTARNDLTVDFDLKQPYPSLPFVLAFPSSAIIPAKSIETEGKNLYKGAPLPTAGRFQVASLQKDQITLRANPNYAGPQPSTKTLVFKSVTDSNARLAQVQGGEIDYAEAISPKQAAQLSGLVQARTARNVIGSYMLILNNRRNSLLSDVRLRRAIAVAIDRNQINKVAYAGQSQPTLGLFASSSSYYKPFLPAGSDVESAKQLLVGTKCANGCTLRLMVASDDQTRVDTAVVVQQNLQAIGIQVKIQTADSATVEEGQGKGTCDVCVNSTYGYGDLPDDIAGYLLGSSTQTALGGYSSAEMDRILGQLATSSGSARDAAAGRVNALFENDVPLVPVLDYLVSSASRVPSERFHMGPTFFYFVD